MKRLATETMIITPKWRIRLPGRAAINRSRDQLTIK